MPDYLAYWPNFKEDAARGRWPTFNWYHNQSLFKNLLRGDHIWLIVAGESFGNPAADRGFLAQELVVDRVEDNQAQNSSYPADEFKFLIHAIPAATRKYDPPIDVDRLVRVNAATDGKHVGIVLQQPKKLTDVTSSPFYLLRSRASSQSLP